MVSRKPSQDGAAVDNPSAPKSRRRSSEDTRALLLRTARELVAEVGFRETQMANIAARAGMAIGTVYRHFPNKVQLMTEVVASVSQGEVDAVAGIALGDGSSTERMAEAVWVFAVRALASGRMAHAMVAEPVDAEIEAVRLHYRRKLARVLETIIDQGIREGDFVAQDVAAAASCIVGSLFEGLMGPLAANALTKDEQRSNGIAIVLFCLRGLSAGPARFTPPARHGRASGLSPPAT